ncbi:glycosyl transferase [Desulfosarcina ovata subsp. ovata]|uniref:Glycosyl transferase n=2 Tax=Desulfosarcina ovata TaxID=83564 RepID=A0A5K8AGL7_9BACT|nr:glycosyl transferase [Desulfosarcina ovata subsp. ovata]
MMRERDTVFQAPRRSLLSIIVPVFNEQEVLREFHSRLSAALVSAQVDEIEILFVNDGSTDETLGILREMARTDQRIQVIDLSRNFGKEAAMTAGLEFASGDAAVIIDADLQDPPELIPQMVEEWRNGFDMVYMRRLSRQSETWLKKTSASAFYWLMGLIGRVQVPENVGDFRLLSRRAIDALNRMLERTRFMKGLFAWIGFPAKEIAYHREPRQAGKTKWNYWQLWNFALEGFTSFTITPLKLASYVGVLTSLASLLYGLFVFLKTLLTGDPVPGYPSLIVVIAFLGGLQLLALGIIGEYLGRMFIEAKQRPLYLVNRHYKTIKRHTLSLVQDERVRS